MLAFIIFSALIIAILLSAIAIFTDEIKHEHANKETLHDILNNK